MDNGTERAAEPNDQVNAAANEENTALRSQAEPVESTSATPDACSVKDGGTESSDASDAAYNSTEAPAGESAIDATADEAEAAGDPLDGGEVLAEDAYGVSVTEAQIAQAEVVAKLAVLPDIDDILKHRVNTDSTYRTVLRHAVKDTLAPRVFYSIGGMKQRMVPELWLFL